MEMPENPLLKLPITSYGTMGWLPQKAGMLGHLTTTKLYKRLIPSKILNNPKDLPSGIKLLR